MRQRLSSEPDRYRGRRRVPTPPRSRYALVVTSAFTLNADENEAVVDASGLEPDATLADEWPQFRHPTRPEFLLTLPHVHRTSGFFIARLRVP